MYCLILVLLFAGKIQCELIVRLACTEEYVFQRKDLLGLKTRILISMMELVSLVYPDFISAQRVSWCMG